jgi:S1-C subfamily serine protease
VDAAWDTAKNLAEFGTVKRGYLGIRSQLVEVPDSVQAELDREQETGLLVVHIEADSPALNGGLLVGDIIIGIAGNPVRDHDELLSQLTGTIVGKPTQVEVLRGGLLETIVIVVGERPVHKHGRHGKPGRHHGHHRHR